MTSSSTYEKSFHICYIHNTEFVANFSQYVVFLIIKEPVLKYFEKISNFGNTIINESLIKKYFQYLE